MTMNDWLIMIAGAAFFWVFMYIVFVTDNPEERGPVSKAQVMNVWGLIAMIILTSFIVWGVCKTEQRLDWLEDLIERKVSKDSKDTTRWSGEVSNIQWSLPDLVPTDPQSKMNVILWTSYVIIGKEIERVM